MAASAPHPDMPYRVLGRTNEPVSAIGRGGWHLALKHVDEARAQRLVHSSVDGGVSLKEHCWGYNDGDSGRRMGKACQRG